MKGLPSIYTQDPEMRRLASQIQSEIVRSSPNVKFEDVIGLQTAKSLLKEVIEIPLIFPEVFETGNDILNFYCF